ncbi:unnamed protein product [Adineta ricciae]|uniref:G-protein coupled receptors family 1 profile domain-containing protein n=1 Tax=Adineta ricciae TaxID=249248 RepID=A0A815S176_ADIRI|nr:unnamed protein product [Adineta ricciae]CAF1485583.1 unnamed protein product [Adineta ricciae]
MDNSTTGGIEFISRRLLIIVGIIMIVLGLIGNLLNIFVFTIWSRPRQRINHTLFNNRTTNSSIYLLISSLVNLIIIGYPFTTRILFDGYQYHVTRNAVIPLCKLRYYSLHTFNTISLTCVCMATFDRYLISSRNVRLRHMSTTRQGTKCVIFMIVLLNLLHGIPIAIYYDVSEDGQCYVTSRTYLYYYRYTFQIILHGILPVTFFSLFGILISKQMKEMKVRKVRNKSMNVDKQLLRMLLLISITIVLSSVSYSCENIYYLIFVDSDRQQTGWVLFAHNICSLLFYTNSVGSFYIYSISTRNFRCQVRKLFRWRTNGHHTQNYRMKTVTSAN